MEQKNSSVKNIKPSNEVCLQVDGPQRPAPAPGPAMMTRRPSHRIPVLLPQVSMILPKLLESPKNSVHRVKPLVQRQKSSSLRDGPSAGVEYPYMMSPTCPLKLYWDIYMAIAVTYLCWIVPFMVAMDWWEVPSSVSNLNTFLDLCSVVDIVIHFRTGIIHFGSVIMEPKVVATTYVKTWFFIDFIAALPIETLVSVIASVDSAGSASTARKSIKLLKYVKLPKLLRLGQLVRKSKQYQRYQGTSTILFAFLFSVHILSCLWIALLRPCELLENNDDQEAFVMTGGNDEFCRQEHVYVMYWLSVYSTTLNMLGIGSENIFDPMNPVSIGYTYHDNLNPDTNLTGRINSGYLCYVSITCVIGLSFVALFFGSAVQLVGSWNRAGYEFRKQVDSIKYEMEYLNLPYTLRNRIKTYYDYLWHNQRVSLNQLHLLQDSNMSSVLRDEILIVMYKEILIQIPLFKHAEDQLLTHISRSLRSVVYLNQDKIITKGELGRELFIIAKGSVLVFDPEIPNDANSTPLDDDDDIVLSDGSFFGEIALVMDVVRTRSIVALTICECCVLDKENFDSILCSFPNFAQGIQDLVTTRAFEDNGTGTMSDIQSQAEAGIDQILKNCRQSCGSGPGSETAPSLSLRKRSGSPGSGLERSASGPSMLRKMLSPKSRSSVMSCEFEQSHKQEEPLVNRLDRIEFMLLQLMDTHGSERKDRRTTTNDQSVIR